MSEVKNVVSVDPVKVSNLVASAELYLECLAELRASTQHPEHCAGSNAPNQIPASEVTP